MSFSQTVIAGTGFCLPFSGENFKKVLEIYNDLYNQTLTISPPEGELDFGQIDFWDALETSYQMQCHNIKIYLYSSEGESDHPIVILDKSYFTIDERLESSVPRTNIFSPSEELKTWAEVFSKEIGLVHFSEVN